MSETAYSREILHNRAYDNYKHLQIKMTLPVIILSCLAGTINVSQGSFDQQYQQFIAFGTGAVNILCSIITTIAQFLKINELCELHRSSAQSFSKLARDIDAELQLPRDQRGSNGLAFITTRQNEISQLIDQAPLIEEYLARQFMKENKNLNFHKPHLFDVAPVEVFNEYASETLNQEHKIKTRRKTLQEIELNNMGINEITYAPPSIAQHTLQHPPGNIGSDEIFEQKNNLTTMANSINIINNPPDIPPNLGQQQ